MGTTFEGELVWRGGRFAIVASRFNELVTKSLVEGARAGLARHGVPNDDVDLAWVSGSFEIPLVAKKMAESGEYAAVVCVGAVIRGDTDHYSQVAAAVTSGIGRAALDTGVPVLFGVLTCDTVEQALNRSGLKAGNKGYEAAVAAVEMVNLLTKVVRNTESLVDIPRIAT